jgi:hypothetical protein
MCSRVLRRLVRLSTARPGLTVALAAALALASVLYALAHLRLETSTRALLPQGRPFIDRYVELDREFGELDDLVIAVEAPSVPEAVAYAERLVGELRARRVPLRRIVHRIDPAHFEGRALLYLPADEVALIRDRIFDHQELLEDFALRPTLDTFVQGIARQVAVSFAAGFLDLGLGGGGLTHAIGFGSLLVAGHRGIFGLGLLLTLGSVVIVLVSLAVLPVLLGLTAGSSPAARPAPAGPGGPVC